MSATLPLVSVVIPCRNEREFIGPRLDTLLNGEWPRDRLEILVVDGRSDDGTRELVSERARQDPRVRLIDNPARTTPYALNLGVRNSRGEFVAILSAHSTSDERYLARCYEASERSGADNVGGLLRILPRKATPIGKAIALTLAHPFGAGNATYRTGATAPREVDTVAFGFYRRNVFDRIGLFNEALTRGQDMELNLRLLRSGGRIVLDPSIAVSYFARSDLVPFWRHNFADGYWVTYAARSAWMPVSWRHLVPLAFVSALAGSALLWAVTPIGGVLLGLIAGAYIATSLAVSASLAVRERDPRLLLTLPLAFAVRHVAYGIGSVAGLVALGLRH